MTIADVALRELVTLPSDQNATGRSLGAEEVYLLSRVIASGRLTSTKGTYVQELEHEFAKKLGIAYASACSSGTAAIHTAVAVIDPDPGEEIITSPITDMGAITPILYQGAIPVFADVDPKTCNVTAQTIEACVSSRTRAIIVTHLFGNPCEMDEIMALAERHRLPVIEDCAQAYGARSAGRPVGTIGAIGCFSLQQSKHMTAGEGGLVVTDDETLAHRIRLFINKAWDYEDPRPDHGFLALNYRMSELQGAVAVAQLAKLDGNIVQRRATARRLGEKLSGLRGITTPWVAPSNLHSYWKYCLWVDPRSFPGGCRTLVSHLQQNDIQATPHYVGKPAFQCELFRRQKTFGRSRFPFSLARPEAVDYSPARFPGVFQGLAELVVLPWNERYAEEHLDFIASSIIEAARGPVRELR